MPLKPTQVLFVRISEHSNIVFNISSDSLDEKSGGSENGGSSPVIYHMVINKDRKRRKRVNEGTDMDKWKNYFMELLRVWRKGAERGEEREGKDGEEELRKKEIGRVVRGLKERKAVGVEGLANEIWKYTGEEVEEWVWKFWNKVWRGEGWPEVWKEGCLETRSRSRVVHFDCKSF